MVRELFTQGGVETETSQGFFFSFNLFLRVDDARGHPGLLPKRVW